MKEKSDYIGAVIFVGIVLACILGSCAIEYAKYGECTRVHPIWYCLLK